MDKEKILGQLTPIFRTVFNEESLVLSDSLTSKEVASWDSITHVLLIMEVEKSFSIKFNFRELNKMRDVGMLVQTIQTKLAPSS